MFSENRHTNPAIDTALRSWLRTPDWFSTPRLGKHANTFIVVPVSALVMIPLENGPFFSLWMLVDFVSSRDCGLCLPLRTGYREATR